MCDLQTFMTFWLPVGIMLICGFITLRSLVVEGVELRLRKMNHSWTIKSCEEPEVLGTMKRWTHWQMIWMLDKWTAKQFYPERFK